MRITYTLKGDKGSITMDPMGNQGNIPNSEIQTYNFEADDRIMSIYSGRQDDVIKFLKFTSLKSKVQSIGKDSYNGGNIYDDYTLGSGEKIVSMRACFKKEFGDDLEFEVFKKGSKFIY